MTSRNGSTPAGRSGERRELVLVKRRRDGRQEFDMVIAPHAPEITLNDVRVHFAALETQERNAARGITTHNHDAPRGGYLDAQRAGYKSGKSRRQHRAEELERLLRLRQDGDSEAFHELAAMTADERGCTIPAVKKRVRRALADSVCDRNVTSR